MSPSFIPLFSMRIGVFSDVHDERDNLNKALELYKGEGIDTLVFCGDFCSPIPAKMMGTFKGQIYCVFGNGDGDRITISSIPNLKFQAQGEHAVIELPLEVSKPDAEPALEVPKAKIAVTHYPLYGNALARTGDYQAVFSGHSHQIHEEHFGETLWLNPGDVYGLNGTATCAIYDLLTKQVEIKTLS